MQEDAAKRKSRAAAIKKARRKKKVVANVDSEVAERPLAAEMHQSGSAGSSAQREKTAGPAELHSSDGAERGAAGKLCVLTLDEAAGISRPETDQADAADVALPAWQLCGITKVGSRRALHCPTLLHFKICRQYNTKCMLGAYYASRGEFACASVVLISDCPAHQLSECMPRNV